MWLLSDVNGFECYYVIELVDWLLEFKSLQHLRLYQARYRLVTARNPSDFTAPLGNQPDSTMTRYLKQSRYPDTEPTSPFPTLIMLCARLESDMQQSCKSLV